MTSPMKGTETQTAQFSSVFPNPVTQALSVLFMQKIVGLSVSTICYVRRILPKKCYVTKIVDGIPLKLLSDTEANKESRHVLNLLRGSFDAIDKGYLKQLIFAVHENSSKGPVLETYNFYFKYKDGQDIECTLQESTTGLNQEFKSSNVGDVADNLKKTTLDLMKSCLVLKNGFRALPDNRVITMKLLYYAETPDDYEPKGFHAADETDYVYASELSARKFTLGKVTTKFHETKVQMKSVCCIENIIFGEQEPVEFSPEMSAARESDQFVPEVPLKNRSNVTVDPVDTLPKSPSKDDSVQLPNDIVSPYISSNDKSKLTKNYVKSSDIPSPNKLAPTLEDNSMSSPVSHKSKSLGESNDGKTVGSTSSLPENDALSDVPLKKKSKLDLSTKMKEKNKSTNKIDSSNVLNNSNAVSKSASKNDNSMGPPKSVPRQLNQRKKKAGVSDSDEETGKDNTKKNMKKHERRNEKKTENTQSKRRVKIQEPHEQNNNEMKNPLMLQILPRTMTKRRSLLCETLKDSDMLPEDKVKKSRMSVSNDSFNMESEEVSSGIDKKITPKSFGKRKLFPRQIDNHTFYTKSRGDVGDDSLWIQDNEMDKGDFPHPRNSDTEDITEFSEASSMITDAGKVIRCECKNTNEFYLIVQCSFCKTWQHAACYGYYDDFIEYGHCCVKCAKEDNSRQCSEPLFLEINQNRYPAKCVYRCGLIVCDKMDIVGHQDFMQILNLSGKSAHSLVSLYQKCGILPQGPHMEEMVINKAMLKSTIETEFLRKSGN